MLKRLELTEDLLTGVEAVDNQHRRLFAWGNELLFPDDIVAGEELFMKTLRNLHQYVHHHFSTEQRAMRTVDYPRYRQHAKEHRFFKEQIEDLGEAVKVGGPGKAVRMKLHYLFSDWFTQHIRETDRATASFLKKHRDALGPIFAAMEAIEADEGMLADLREMRVHTPSGLERPGSSSGILPARGYRAPYPPM